MVLEFTNHLGRLTTVKRGEDSGRLQLVGRVVKKDGDNEICYLGGVILPSRRSASRDRLNREVDLFFLKNYSII